MNINLVYKYFSGENPMKVRKLIKKLYVAIIRHRKDKEQSLYRKITKKSLKGKKTHVVN